MFDHINFYKNFSNLDISASYILENIDKQPVKQPTDSFLNSDFHIQGTVRCLQPLPMSEQNRKQYMYIQAFCYMDASPNYYAKQKNYASYQMLLTHSGQGEILYEDNRYTLNKGAVFLIDCKKPQSYHTVGSHWEFSDLHFYGGKSDFLYKEFIEKTSPLFMVEDFNLIQSLLEEVLKSHTSISFYREWNVSCCIENLLRRLFESSKEQFHAVPERIQYLITYINHNFNKPLTLDGLAEFSGISKYHLVREFKKYTGFPPHEYITELRIERAKSLLMQTSIPAYKVGMLVGIPNETNFIRIFKEKNKLTPGEYRAMK